MDEIELELLKALSARTDVTTSTDGKRHSARFTPTFILTPTGMILVAINQHYAKDDDIFLTSSDKIRPEFLGDENG